MSLVTTDKDVEYELTTHLYLPQASLFENRLNISIDKLGGEEEYQIFQRDCAEFIKDFCVYYNRYDTSLEAKKKYEVSLYENANDEVEELKRAYVEYARYAINDEGDLIGGQTGVDFVKYTLIPLEELRGNRELSSRLERILRNAGLLVKGEQTWLADNMTDGVRGTDY